jgi:hypothetical protein
MRLFHLYRIIFAVTLFSQTSIFAQTNPEQNVRETILHVNDVYQFMPVDGETHGKTIAPKVENRIVRTN